MDGTFLLNSIPTLVLFGSGVSRSFVSSYFCRGFSITQETLTRPLRVSISDEHPAFATDIYKGFVLEIFGVGYLKDLITIAMRDVYVTVGIDWLSRFGALIECKRRMVTV